MSSSLGNIYDDDQSRRIYEEKNIFYFNYNFKNAFFI